MNEQQPAYVWTIAGAALALVLSIMFGTLSKRDEFALVEDCRPLKALEASVDYIVVDLYLVKDCQP